MEYLSNELGGFRGQDGGHESQDCDWPGVEGVQVVGTGEI